MGRTLAPKPRLEKNGTVQIITRVPPKLRKELYVVAGERGETLTTVTNKALQQYVDGLNRKRRR